MNDRKHEEIRSPMKLFVNCAVTLATAAAFSAAAWSAEFPSRPVRIVVPSTPGGALDVLGRILQPRLTAKWNQQVVIDNRAGAAGIVGSEIAAKSTPDGHTIL